MPKTVRWTDDKKKIGSLGRKPGAETVEEDSHAALWAKQGRCEIVGDGEKKPSNWMQLKAEEQAAEVPAAATPKPSPAPRKSVERPPETRAMGRGHLKNK